MEFIEAIKKIENDKILEDFTQKYEEKIIENDKFHKVIRANFDRFKKNQLEVDLNVKSLKRQNYTLHVWKLINKLVGCLHQHCNTSNKKLLHT